MVLHRQQVDARDLGPVRPLVDGFERAEAIENLAEIVDAEGLLIRGQSRQRGRASAAVSTATALDSGARETFELTAGARAWVVKPFQPEHLLGAVQKLCLP